ncbi:LTA synthase family protein [Desulfosarcina sp. OttesenSCG-928-A07]|nr:LTA synthase family protein [Desulfosarcina sp. OttesenSCG-928-G17]MDL2329834.1 LTA synthase family protein [Desulfosarcina sp. OttesenSCG-928-A07]
MQVTEPLLTVMAAAFSGLCVTVGLERFLRPAPNFFRPRRAWIIHVGLWLCAYGLCTLFLGHPWFAAGFAVAVFFILIQVSNAKIDLLKEPFVFQDYMYFLDTIRYPRLYLPFFGWKNFLIAAAGVLLVIVGYIIVFPVIRPAPWAHVWGGTVGGIGAGMLFLCASAKSPLPGSFEPEADIRQLGFLPCLWHYYLSGRTLPAETSPFSGLMATKASCSSSFLPHLVAVQSESFVDPRTLSPDIRADLLTDYDTLKTQAQSWGKLHVPAWGANTVRTEFAFLSGIPNAHLGVHRFEPYRAVAQGWHVASLAMFLKSLGYRTLCIHPYEGRFYLRDRVLPLLGFDQFWDAGAFAGTARFGPYTSDIAVGEKVMETLKNALQPVFLFVITMENHGPLHLEKITPTDINALYARLPEPHFHDLTVYLRHIRNANQMIANLQTEMANLNHPASLCWYGDHIPIMPKVYGAYGTPPGDVEYVLWNNDNSGRGDLQSLAVHQLAPAWLGHLPNLMSYGIKATFP